MQIHSGIIRLYVEVKDANSIVAEVNGLGTITDSIKWIDNSTNTTLKPLEIEKLAYNWNDKTIQLTFNHDIYEPSVISN